MVMGKVSLLLSHPSPQVKVPVHRGFRWVSPSEILKPPKSGNILKLKIGSVGMRPTAAYRNERDL